MGFTARELEQIERRISRGRSRRAAAPQETVALCRAGPGSVILGIDPSLRGTGFGVIRKVTRGWTALAYGTVECPSSWEHSRCLARIAVSLREVVRLHHPDVCVVEGLFHAQNLKTAIVMGEARGAALAAAAEAGLEVYEVAPRKVKRALVGYGAAQKSAVAHMVHRMLSLREMPAADAADALAVALTHAMEQKSYGLSSPKRI